MKKTSSSARRNAASAGGVHRAPAVAGSRFVVSVLVADRVGILRDLTAALLDLDGRIETLSQTVVEGYFTVTLIASFRGPAVPAAIRDRLLRNFPAGEASLQVRPYEAGAAQPVVSQGDRYVLIVMGPPRADLTARLTAFLADKRINIEDWYMDLRGGEAVYLSELTIPAALDRKQIQDEIGRRMAAMGLRASLQHENIFRATNDVGPIASLLAAAGGRAT